MIREDMVDDFREELPLPLGFAMGSVPVTAPPAVAPPVMAPAVELPVMAPPRGVGPERVRLRAAPRHGG